MPPSKTFELERGGMSSDKVSKAGGGKQLQRAPGRRGRGATQAFLRHSPKQCKSQNSRLFPSKPGAEVGGGGKKLKPKALDGRYYTEQIT